MILNVSHININVTDIRASIDFYERLGFKLLRTFGQAFPEDDPGGEPGDSGGLCGAVLGISDDPRARTGIELIQWPRSSPAQPKPPSDLEPGVARIAIRTKNLRAYCEELKARGIEFLHDPQEVNVIGVKRFVLFRDPDGTLLELIEL